MKPADRKSVLESTFRLAVRFIFLTFILMVPWILNSASHAAGPLIPGMQEVEKLDLIAGKTITLQSREPIKRVYVADPDIAEADVFSPGELVLTGKAPAPPPFPCGRKTTAWWAFTPWRSTMTWPG